MNFLSGQIQDFRLGMAREQPHAALVHQDGERTAVEQAERLAQLALAGERRGGGGDVGG